MDKIIELIKGAWDLIDKIFAKVFSFAKNLVGFFKAKIGLAKKRSANVKALSVIIKDKLKSGDFNEIDINLGNTQIVNTFFDVDKGEIMEDLSEVVGADSLDQETIRKFGNKEMIILN